MIYVLEDWENIQSIYEGPEIDVDAEAILFDRQYYGVEPFVRFPGWTSAHLNDWRQNRKVKIEEAERAGKTQDFHEWLIEKYDLKRRKFTVLSI